MSGFIIFQSLLQCFVLTHLKYKFFVTWISIVWVLWIQHSNLLASNSCMATTASLSACYVRYRESTSQLEPLCLSRADRMLELPFQSSTLQPLLLKIITLNFTLIVV